MRSPPVRNSNGPIRRAINLMPPMSWDEKTVAFTNMDSEDLSLLGKWVFVMLLLVKIDGTVICGKAFFLPSVDEV